LAFVISGDVTRRRRARRVKTAGEIRQAMIDYQSGRFGEID
jgi:hypothetical protein